MLSVTLTWCSGKSLPLVSWLSSKEVAKDVAEGAEEVDDAEDAEEEEEADVERLKERREE